MKSFEWLRFLSLVAVTIAAQTTAEDICISESKVYTAIVDLFAGELGKSDIFPTTSSI